MSKPTASLSFDLDNLWSYMKTHGSPQWEAFPTYLPMLVPQVLDWFKQREQRVTFFVVGQDAALERNHEALRQVAQAGHEIGNHSFNHEQWMHTFSEEKLVEELRRVEEAIALFSDQKPVGFRGPGFCNSPILLRALKRLGYQYDASLLPSVLGPVARLYYLWGTRMSQEDSQDRRELFGKMSNGLMPLRAFEWQTPIGNIVEVPVTTIPVFRVPFHLSYILWLSGFSKPLAIQYLKFALAMCRLRRVEPSFLLHPLDFIGREDAPPELAFFPGMQLSRAHKMEIADQFIDLYQKHFEVVPLGEHVQRIKARGRIKVVPAVQPEPGALGRIPRDQEQEPILFGADCAFLNLTIQKKTAPLDFHS